MMYFFLFLTLLLYIPSEAMGCSPLWEDGDEPQSTYQVFSDSSLLFMYNPHYHAENLLAEKVGFDGFVTSGFSTRLHFFLLDRLELTGDYDLSTFQLIHPRLNETINRLQHKLSLGSYYYFPTEYRLNFKLGLKASLDLYRADMLSSSAEDHTTTYLESGQIVAGIGPSVGLSWQPLEALPLSLYGLFGYIPYAWVSKNSPLFPDAVQQIAWETGIRYKWWKFVVQLEYYDIQEFNTGWRRQNNGLRGGIGYILF